jgi:hypothetical protein
MLHFEHDGGDILKRSCQPDTTEHRNDVELQRKHLKIWSNLNATLAKATHME